MSEALNPESFPATPVAADAAALQFRKLILFSGQGTD